MFQGKSDSFTSVILLLFTTLSYINHLSIQHKWYFYIELSSHKYTFEEYFYCKALKKLDRTQLWSVNGMPLPAGQLSLPKPHIGPPENSFVVCNFSPWPFTFQFCLYSGASHMLYNPNKFFSDSPKLLPIISEWSCGFKTAFLAMWWP